MAHAGKTHWCRPAVVNRRGQVDRTEISKAQKGPDSLETGCLFYPRKAANLDNGMVKRGYVNSWLRPVFAE
jgi:hypothetical protein